MYKKAAVGLVLIICILSAGCTVISSEDTAKAEAVKNQSPIHGKTMRVDEIGSIQNENTSSEYLHTFGYVYVIAYCEERAVCYIYRDNSDGSSMQCMTDITGPLIVAKYCGKLEDGK